MDNYKNLFMDIDNFEEENMSYIKPLLFYKVSRNIGIYYKKAQKDQQIEKSNKETKKNKTKPKTDKPTNQQIKKQKIIVQTPKMIVPFKIQEFVNNNKKSYQMSLSFTTLTNLYNEDEIKKFYLFIKKLDTINDDTISEYKKAWGLPKNLNYRKTLQRLSNDYPHYMNLNLPYDEKRGFLFHIYDETANKSTIDIIEKRSIVSVVIELTDLKFGNKDFRSNWTVLQIRKMKPYSPIQDFFMSGCFICDEDDPEDTAYKKIIEKYQQSLETPIVIPKIPQLNPNYVNPHPHESRVTHKEHPQLSVNDNKKKTSDVIFTPPSLNELISAKKSLKKTITIVKEVSNVGKVVDENEGSSKLVKNKDVDKSKNLAKCRDNPLSKLPPPPPNLLKKKANFK